MSLDWAAACLAYVRILHFCIWPGFLSSKRTDIVAELQNLNKLLNQQQKKSVCKKHVVALGLSTSSADLLHKSRGRKMWGIIFRLFLNLPIPKIISHKNCQLWSILPNLCQVCEAIVFLFCSNFPTLFQFSWHFSNIRDRVCRVCTHVPCGTGLLASAPPSSSPLRPYKPGSASEPSLLYYVPGFGIARHCKLALFGIASRHCTLHVGIAKSSALPTGRLGLSCALWSVNEYTPVFMWGWSGVEVAWSRFWRIFSFLLIQLSVDWYFKPVTSNQYQLMACEQLVCEVFVVAVSSKETSPRVYCLRRARVFQCLVFQCLDRV